MGGQNNMDSAEESDVSQKIYANKSHHRQQMTKQRNSFSLDRLLKTELTHKSKMSQRDRLKKFIKKTDQRTQHHSESMHDRNGSEQKLGNGNATSVISSCSSESTINTKQYREKSISSDTECG